jgi:Ras family protein T1
LIAECQATDAVVLTWVDCLWLPHCDLSCLICVMQLKAPVIVLGCKLDLRDEQQVSLEQVMAPIMQSFCAIDTCTECFTLRQIQVTPDLIILD